MQWEEDTQSAVAPPLDERGEEKREAPQQQQLPALERPSRATSSAAAAAASTSVSATTAPAVAPVPSVAVASAGPSNLPRARTLTARAPVSPRKPTPAPATAGPSVAAAASASSRSLPTTPHKRRSKPSAAVAAAAAAAGGTAVAAPPPLAAPAAPAPLFDGMRILFVGGPELTAKRIQLLTVQVIRRAGRVIASTPSAMVASGSGSGLIMAAGGSGHMGSGSGRGSVMTGSGSTSTRSKPPRATHVLFGGLNGDYDGRVAEVAATMSSRARDAATFASVEWLSLCLKKQAREDIEPFRLRLEEANHAGAGGRPHMSRADSIAAGAGVAFTPLQASATQAAAPVSKRDIRYVMDAMEDQQRAQQQPLPDSHMPPLSRPSSLPPPSSASSSSQPTVKIESNYLGFDLSSSQQRLQMPLSPLMEGSGSQQKGSGIKKEEEEEWTSPARVGATAAAAAGPHKRTPKRLKLDSSLPTAASQPPPPDNPALSLLASSYSQAVPSFAEAVPYDASIYLPLKEHGSYLNPDSSSSSVSLPLPLQVVDSKGRVGWNGGAAAASSYSPFSSSVVGTGAAGAAGAGAAAPPPFHPHPKSATAGAWIDKNKAHLACQIFSSQHKNQNAHLTGPLEQLEGMVRNARSRNVTGSAAGFGLRPLTHPTHVFVRLFVSERCHRRQVAHVRISQSGRYSQEVASAFVDGG